MKLNNYILVKAGLDNNTPIDIQYVVENGIQDLESSPTSWSLEKDDFWLGNMVREYVVKVSLKK